METLPRLAWQLVVFPGHIPGPNGMAQRHIAGLGPAQGKDCLGRYHPMPVKVGDSDSRRGSGHRKRMPASPRPRARPAMTAATSARRRHAPMPSRGTNCLLSISPEPRAIEQTELRGKTKSTGHGAHKLEVERPHTRRRRF